MADQDDEHWYDNPWWTPGRDPESDRRWPSVTTILGRTFVKWQLRPWAAREAAGFAFDNGPILADLAEERARTAAGLTDRAGPVPARAAVEGRNVAVTLAAETSDRIADDAAETGVQVHAWLEAHLKGEPRNFDDDAWRRITPFIPVLLDFLARCAPDPDQIVWAEATVHHEVLRYSGTTDLGLILPFPLPVIERLPREQGGGARLLGVIPAGVVIVVDLKTGKEVRPDAAHQLVGYAECTHLDPKTGGPLVRMPRAGGGAVLHVTPAGWKLHPVLLTKGMRHAWRHAVGWFHGPHTHHRAAAGIGVQPDGDSLSLTGLPGIPAAVAAALALQQEPVLTLADLEQYGPAAYLGTPGIGAKRLELARGLLALEGRAWPDTTPAGTTSRKAA
ncbi:hypothetical protein [Parafrankia discariae]|uniref:hypothetical protein n=1 Tax=Parafrankia discariae TaxID=365528 RepID=UPI000380B535|nr:hypothetical protein [Parafrankia discariae]